jgi:hypothetical protein
MTAPGTDAQRRFALEYASGSGNASEAARKAGYSARSAAEIGRQLLEKSHVRQMIHEELVKLRVRSGTIGLAALHRIAESKDAPPAAVVAAARTLLEHAGMIGSVREPGELPDEAGGNVVSYEALLEKMGQNRQAATG